jgi:RNA polymerase sigma-70 factor (ECF subfamily)
MTGNHRTAPRMNQANKTSVPNIDKRDQTANGAINSRYSRSQRDRLVRLAYRFLWNQDDAEDVAQDALTIAIDRSEDLRDDDKWWSWMCRIVVHRCHELGRRRKRWQKHEPMVVAGINQQAEAPSLEEQAQPSDRMRDCLNKLPKRQQEVIVLRHFEGMPYERIAEVLEIKAATARVHARAGREMLRTLLLEHWTEQGQRS